MHGTEVQTKIKSPLKSVFILLSHFSSLHFSIHYLPQNRAFKMLFHLHSQLIESQLGLSSTVSKWLKIIPATCHIFCCFLSRLFNSCSRSHTQQWRATKPSKASGSAQLVCSSGENREPALPSTPKTDENKKR